jgi:hypothetical protein
MGLRMKLEGKLLFIGLMVLGFVGQSALGMAQPAVMEDVGGIPQDKIAHDNLAFAVPAKEKGGATLDFHNWRGFALKDHESYVLRISIESIRPVGPRGARRFLASNMTIEEIRREISAKEANPTFRGYLKFEDSVYWLINIKVTNALDNLILESDIADLKESVAHEIIATNVGQIKVNTTIGNNTMKGRGEMIMTEGPHIGHFQLFLDMASRWPEQ